MASIQRGCHAECQRKCAMLRCFNKSARKSSPCSACGRQQRDKIRPAYAKISEKAAFRASWASFFTELLLEGPCRASFFALTGALLRCEVLAALSTPAVVGAPHEAVLQPVAGVLDPRVVHFPRCTVSHSIVWARGSFVCCWWHRSPLYARIPHSYNKTARRAAGREWSGRRESNPRCQLGKLKFYH